MTNGVYSIKYTGVQGFGSACLVLMNGEVFGVDIVGAEYTGIYKVEGDKIVGEVNIHVPAGATLVTGAPVSPQPYTIPVPVSIPAALKEQETVQIRIQLPTGPVNANVKKVKNIA